MKPVSRGRKIVDWIVGSLLLLLGLVGLVLPGIQGILFILAGLAILSSHSALARRVHEAAKSMIRDVRDRIANRE